MSQLVDYKNCKDTPINDDINCAIEDLRTISGNTMDLNIMNIKIDDVKCSVVTIEGMVSTSSMADLVFRPIMEIKDCKDKSDIFTFLTSQSLLAAERKTIYNYGDVFQYLFSGFCVIFIDGLNKAVAYGIQGYDKRSISTPDSEQTVRAAQDSFTETIRTNLSLVRRRMKTPSLRFEMLQCGNKSSTDVCMMYLMDRAAPEIVDKLRSRLKKIKLDTIMSSGYIEPFIDESYGKSVFSSVMVTQRPDMICTRLNEGRICILVDGTPYCVVCPSLFADNFQTMDDFCTKSYYATFIRWLKYIAFILAVGLPGLYVALVLFHPEVFTLKLLLNLYASEVATPYPLPVEMTLLVILFEIMREAGIRLPKSVGSAVSIVGGLIIGDAAVKSGLISAPLLIVVGITATSAFVVPQLNQQISIIRLLFIFAGSAAGLFGIAVCTTLLIVNICAMDDFSISYLAPVSPFYKKKATMAFFRPSFRRYEQQHDVVEQFRSDTGMNEKK